jgi:hypothetical protein
VDKPVAHADDASPREISLAFGKVGIVTQQGTYGLAHDRQLVQDGCDDRFVGRFARSMADKTSASRSQTLLGIYSGTASAST